MGKAAIRGVADANGGNEPAAAARFDPRLVEAIALRVAELLERGSVQRRPELVDAAELARRLGIDRSWVYTHADELGAVRLGGGRKPRLRFDPNLAAGRVAGEPPEKSAKPRRSSRRRPPPEQRASQLLPVKGEGES